LHVGETYTAIEKQLVKRQRKGAKRRWLKSLLIKDDDTESFNIMN
jgi:hypothetical protein